MNLYICSNLAKSRLFQHRKVLPITCFLIQSDAVESAGLYFCYIYTASPKYCSTCSTLGKLQYLLIK